MSEKENKGGRPKSGKNPFTEIFGKLVGEGATQQEIADKIGVTRQNVGKWLSGITTPDIVTLVKIADAYGVSTDYLLGRTEKKTADIKIQAICDYTGLSEEAIEKLNHYFSANNKENKPIEDLRKNWAEAASRIIEKGFLLRFADKMAELANISEYYSNTFFNFEPEESFKFAEKFSIDPLLFWSLLFDRSFKFQEKTPIPDEYAVGDGLVGNIKEQCDLCRYELIKNTEKMIDMFDHRKDWQNYTREQLLEYLNITEDQLKELQAEAERLNKRDTKKKDKRNAKNGKHNAPKE